MKTWKRGVEWTVDKVGVTVSGGDMRVQAEHKRENRSGKNHFQIMEPPFRVVL
jgi:hypothetical protein